MDVKENTMGRNVCLAECESWKFRIGFFEHFISSIISSIFPKMKRSTVCSLVKTIGKAWFAVAKYGMIQRKAGIAYLKLLKLSRTWVEVNYWKGEEVCDSLLEAYALYNLVLKHVQLNLGMQLGSWEFGNGKQDLGSYELGE